MNRLLCISAAVLALTWAGSAEARGGGGHSGRSSGSSSYGTGSNSHSHRVEGYTKKDGTYVAPHYQTNPNGTQKDNFSAKGNVNPYTGAVGTKPPKN